MKKTNKDNSNTSFSRLVEILKEKGMKSHAKNKRQNRRNKKQNISVR